jgi:hypothetical protein
MVTPRNTFSGSSFTTPSAVFADPALIAVDNEATASQRAAGEFAALAAFIARTRPPWTDEAACRGSGLDFTNTKSQRNVSACLERCGRCDVRGACLDWALEVDDRVAILGGMTPTARTRLARKRDRPASTDDDRPENESDAAS